MASTVFPVASSASQPTTLPTAIPVGLTLRNTYTSSQTGLTYPAGITQVFVVLVGGGGGGRDAGGVTTGGAGGVGTCLVYY